MNKGFGKSMVFFLVLWFLSAGMVTPCFSKEARTVAVLPFTMNTQQDLAFLQKGIFDMFFSRLSYGDEVVVLTRETLESRLKKADAGISRLDGMTETKAKALGRFLNVDHVLFGSLTLFGNSMSLDVNMVDINTEQPTLTFFRQSDTAGAVIPELNKIAEEINFKVYGRETIAFQNQQRLQQEYERQAETYKSPLERFTTLLNNHKGRINSVAVGDLDGDKKLEVVLIDNQSLSIYKVAMGGKLTPVQVIKNKAAAVISISVDVADINQDGFAEIFVTGMNSRQERVSSFVVEYNGSRYVRHDKTYPWYFKVVKRTDGGRPELFAQRHTEKGPWKSNQVFKVIWSNNQYEQGSSIGVPANNFNLLSMVNASGSDRTQSSYLYTDEAGRLVLFFESGKVEWSSDTGYGGSTLRYEFPRSYVGPEMTERNFAYLQPKSVIYDIKGEGKPKLIVIKNIEVSDYLFANTRVYNKGSIEIHSFNDLGLSFESAPKKFQGPVTSIAIGDFDNDGKVELLVSMLKKASSILATKDRSVLVAFELE